VRLSEDAPSIQQWRPSSGTRSATPSSAIAWSGQLPPHASQLVPLMAVRPELGLVGKRYTLAVAPSDPISSEAQRTRGRPPSLSEQDVVAAGLRLTRDVGLANVSMRALARELDVPPMTIYNYVPSKEALHDLVVNHILREIEIPGEELGTWEPRLRKLLRAARDVFAEHPGVSSHLGDRGTAEAVRLAEGVLDILRDGGFSPEAAVLCFTTLFTYMTGQIDLDSMAAAIVVRTPTATLDGVTRSTPFSRDQLFDFGFDAVIEGLKVKLLDEQDASSESREDPA
jgi:TetR/AcrR family transcriptional regulator, tetracycline repressor protein